MSFLKKITLKGFLSRLKTAAQIAQFFGIRPKVAQKVEGVVDALEPESPKPDQPSGNQVGPTSQ